MLRFGPLLSFISISFDLNSLLSVWKWQNARRNGLVCCDVVFWGIFPGKISSLFKFPFDEKSVSGAAISNSYDSETEKKYVVSDITLMTWSCCHLLSVS